MLFLNKKVNNYYAKWKLNVYLVAYKLAEVRIIPKFRKNNSFVYFSQKTNAFVSVVYKLFVSKV